MYVVIIVSAQIPTHMMLGLGDNKLVHVGPSQHMQG